MPFLIKIVDGSQATDRFIARSFWTRYADMKNFLSAVEER